MLIIDNNLENQFDNYQQYEEEMMYLSQHTKKSISSIYSSNSSVSSQITEFVIDLDEGQEIPSSPDQEYSILFSLNFIFFSLLYASILCFTLAVWSMR